MVLPRLGPRTSHLWIRVVPVLAALLSLGATSRCETEGTVYGLTEDAVFVVPLLPCAGPLPCPEGGDLGGTFRLIELPPSLRRIQMFRVEDVYWLARDGTGRDLPITGTGAYTISERSVPTQRLVIDLEVEGVSRRYDSGHVPIDVPFPRIDVTLAAEVPTPFGNEIRVRAMPFPPKRKGTACGPELTCDPDAEICVREQAGLGDVFRCEPVPAGCEDDRTCGCVERAVCSAPSVTICQDEAENTVACICLACI